MNDEIEFEIDADGNATEVEQAPAPTEQPTQDDQAFSPEEENSDAVPVEPEDEPAEETEEDDSAEEKPAQPVQPPVQQLDTEAVTKALTDALNPLIDSLKGQQEQQSIQVQQQKIVSKASKAKQDMQKAQKALDAAARNPQARQTALDDYAKAKFEFDDSVKEAQDLQAKIEGKGGKSSEGGKPSEGGNPPAEQPKEGSEAFNAAEARVEKWMDANKKWFTNDKSSRWYNLSQAAVAESEYLLLNDPDPEVRDLTNDKHWQKVNEFVRSKTRRPETVKGAGGATYSQPPVDTSGGSNIPPTNSSGQSKPAKAKVSKAKLDDVLLGFYGTADRKALGKERVGKAIAIIQKNQKNYKK